MTHVHYWIPTILEASKEALEEADSDSMIPVIPAAICECEERLLPPEVERRINAVERLSAQGAKSIAKHLAEIDKRTILPQTDLLAYAAAREGKDA